MKFRVSALLGLASLTQFAWAAGPLPGKPDGSQGAIKAALVQAKEKLAPLTTWQTALFDDEVLPQGQRFVRDYRADFADVDMEALKNFLAFYAPKALRQEEPKILVELSQQPDCTRCAQASPFIHKLITAKLARRGFVPVFASADETASEPRTQAALNTHLAQAAARKGAASYLYIDWRLQPVDEIDSAHADEKHYQVKLTFHAGHESSSGALELLENESLVTAAERLFTDAVADLGAKTEVSGMAGLQSADEAQGDEFSVIVKGIKSFPQLNGVRARLAAGLVGSASPLEDRKVTRGQFTFAVHTHKSAEEIKRLILSASPRSTAAVEGSAGGAEGEPSVPVRFVVNSLDEKSIQLEAQ